MTRSRIIARSNSAKTPIIWNMARPAGEGLTLRGNLRPVGVAVDKLVDQSTVPGAADARRVRHGGSREEVGRRGGFAGLVST